MESAAGRDPVGFSPNFLGARTTVGQAYARSEARAGIHLSYYRDQRPGAHLRALDRIDARGQRPATVMREAKAAPLTVGGGECRAPADGTR